jgi:hypothetical protein
MTTIKMSGLGADSRRDLARQLMDHALVLLVYLGIVAVFSVVSVIGCVIWLLIW